jgi:hypothetical protein
VVYVPNGLPSRHLRDEQEHHQAGPFVERS